MNKRDLEHFSQLDELVRNARTHVRELLDNHYEVISHKNLDRKIYEMDLFKDVTRLLTRKWAVEILWELEIHLEMSFNDLSRHLKGISSRTLSDTLKDLTDYNLIVREVLDTHPPQVEYYLTDRGKGIVELSMLIIWHLIK
ncbi:MAG: hypothetical protein GF317_22395 [Candidatus Lokiarchaeota archaeon]|nr:hypothetical protein [Candidatus Lokiarchaeota archaeon]MBD3202211.1 hypothetical protein [Candidatus Lokiarchaeota archaeon]